MRDRDAHDREREQHRGEREPGDRRDAHGLGEPRAPPLDGRGVPGQDRRERHPGPGDEQHPDLHQRRPRPGHDPGAQGGGERRGDGHLPRHLRPLGDPRRVRPQDHEVAAQPRLRTDHHLVGANARGPLARRRRSPRTTRWRRGSPSTSPRSTIRLPSSIAFPPTLVPRVSEISPPPARRASLDPALRRSPGRPGPARRPRPPRPRARGARRRSRRRSRSRRARPGARPW